MNSPQFPLSKPLAGEKRWSVGTLTYTVSGLAVLFFWLLWGDFAWNMKERAVAPIAQIMLKGFHASDLIVGLLVGSLPAALGMILAPVISVRSDRHRGRWGRRIPFLLIPVPIAVVGLAGLAFAPAVGEWLHATLGHASPGMHQTKLIAFAFFWTLFEVASVISNAVFGGLINDVVPREVIGRFFGLFRAVSLIAGILFNFWILGHAEAHHTWIFLGIGLLYGVGFPLMCFRVREGEYPPPPVETSDKKVHPLIAMSTYLRECFANPYYVWVFGGITLGFLANGPVNAFSVFYAKSVGMSMDSYGKYLALTYGISLAISYLLGSLADRFHPLRAGIVAIALYAVAMILGGIFATTSGSFAVAFVLHGVLSGTFMTCTASLGQRLFPRTKFAQFASANGMITGAGFLLMPPLVGLLLDFSGHAYRYTFLISGGLALAGFAVLLIAHKKFMKLGGPTAYIAPE